MPRQQSIVEIAARDIDRFARQVTVAITGNLINRTPVDTGLARTNWLPSFTTPRSDIVPIKSNAAARSAAASVLNRPSTRTRRGDVRIFIANNVRYIGSLNRGFSRQAPAGFVEIAINEGIAFADRNFRSA